MSRRWDSTLENRNGFGSLRHDCDLLASQSLHKHRHATWLQTTIDAWNVTIDPDGWGHLELNAVVNLLASDLGFDRVIFAIGHGHELSHLSIAGGDSVQPALLGHDNVVRSAESLSAYSLVLWRGNAPRSGGS